MTPSGDGRHFLHELHALRSVTTTMKIARDLERVADLATNVAEEVVFLVEGTLIRHGSTSG